MDLKSYAPLVKEIGQDLKSSWLNFIIVNLLASFLILLALFIPVLSFSLAFIVMTHLEVGVYGYVLSVKRKKKCSFEDIFLPIKSCIKNLSLKIIVLIGSLVWGLLVIVPGVIYALNSSFAPFILIDNPSLSISEVLEKSKSLVYGKRVLIFVMAMLSILIVASGVGVGVGVYFILSMFFKLPSFVTAMILILFGALAMITLAMPLYEDFLAGQYVKSLVITQENSIKPKKKVKKS